MSEEQEKNISSGLVIYIEGLRCQIRSLSRGVESLTNKLGKHECPNCGQDDKEQLRHRHHDGKTCGVPECNFRECLTCEFQWGMN